MGIEDIRFSQMRTLGSNYYRRKNDPAEIIFENAKTGIRRTVVDTRGGIPGFPGLAHPEVVSGYSAGYMGEQIGYYSYLTLLDGQYALIWQIQPDGRYWEDDDGFGSTADDEINLYARLDETGRFIEPFRIYSIGSCELYGTDEEEKMAETLAMEEDPLQSLREHVPGMLDVMREKISVPEPGSACCRVAGTIYQAEMELRCDEEKWYVLAGMRKMKSGVARIGGLKFLPLDEKRKYLMSKRALEDAVQELTRLYCAIRKEGI